MNIMKNQLAILKNLRNRTVLTYVAILGIIDDPNTNHFLKN